MSINKFTCRQSVLKPARKRGGAKREGVLVDCVDDGRIYSTGDTRKKVIFILNNLSFISFEKKNYIHISFLF